MNSKERVTKTLNHLEPDRVPVFELCVNSRLSSKILEREAIVGTGGGVIIQKRFDMLIDGKRDEYVRRYAQDTVELYQKLGYDILVIDPNDPRDYVTPKKEGDNTWIYRDEKGLESKFRYIPENDAFCEIDSSITKGGIEEFRKVVTAWEKLPTSNRTPDDSEFEAIEYAVRDVGKDMFVVGQADIFVPIYQSWLPVFLEAMILDPPLVKAYIELAYEWAHKSLIAQLQRGVDGIIGRADYCDKRGPLFSPRHFKELIQPYLKRLIDECHDQGAPFIKHIDGNIKPIEQELLIESGVDGYHGIDRVAGMDIGELKSKYGRRITLLGNVDCAALLSIGTPKQVTEATKEIIKIAAPGGGFVLSSSNCIHSDVPLENLYAMLRAAKEFGRHPFNSSE